MTPPNPLHDDVVGLLSAWAFGQLRDSRHDLEIRVQLSMDLARQSSVVLQDLIFCSPILFCATTNGVRYASPDRSL